MSEVLGLKKRLLAGEPCYDMDELGSKTELENKGNAVIESIAVMHEALGRGYDEKDPRVVVFDDPDKKEERGMGHYITFGDINGRPAWFAWDKKDLGTDIGARRPRKGYAGEKKINPATVLHADLEALVDFQRRGVPHEMIDALDATVLFARYVVDNYAKPYLELKAEAFGKDPQKYVQLFFPDGKRAHVIQRVIAYPELDTVPEAMRPDNPDDEKKVLIIKHRDKCTTTVDAWTSGPGLQYQVERDDKKVWVDAEDRIACFEAAADDLLGDDYQGKVTPGTWHRAVAREIPQGASSPILVRNRLARVAMPLFISPYSAKQRVQAKSIETLGS